MPITPMPPVPLRSQPATFADRGDVWCAAFPLWGVEATALEANVNAKEAIVAENTALTVESATISLGASHYKGLWSALTGALSMPASVYHSGKFWVLNANLANVTTAVPGVSASWQRVQTQVDVYPYDSRGTLRSTTSNTTGDQAVVTGLGMFVFELGSTEPDDDESCFATASGCWLLEAVTWDLVDAWQMPDSFDERIDDALASLPAVTAAANNFSVLHGTATSSVTSLAAVTQTSFTATVTGAAIGDRVIATPPDALSSRISTYARVSAANTVTVYLNNPSAASATLVASTWKLTIIKEV